MREMLRTFQRNIIHKQNLNYISHPNPEILTRLTQPCNTYCVSLFYLELSISFIFIYSIDTSIVYYIIIIIIINKDIY